MNILKRAISIFMIISLVVLSFAACSSEKPRPIGKYISNIVVETLDTQVVAENDNFIMTWNNEKACVIVENKHTGYKWSTIPNDYLDGKPAGMRGDRLFNSPLIVTYASPPNNMLKNVNGADAKDEEEGFYTVKKVENGVQVGYFFNRVEISVPLIYKLYDDHFTVTVDTRGILENENKVYQVQIAPFLASAPADNEKQDYLFVPSGSGSLIYTDERDGTERVYQEEVYGDDLAIFTDYLTKQTQKTALPVFGVRRDRDALLGIIEEGSASCSIKASAGDNTIGYSNVCAVFAVRGRNVEVVENAKYGSSRVNNYSEGFVNGNCTVAYYPLSDEDASYSGMANRYREYLTEKYSIKDSKSDSPLYLQILGGALVDKSFIGIPYQSLATATTLSQAKKIISEVTKATGVKPVVQLKGFGESGLDIGEIGGGFDVDGAFGDWDDIKAIQKISEAYFDFDLVRFNSSGSGFSTFSNVAKAENGGSAYQYYYQVAAKNRDEDKGRYNLLSRNKLAEAFNEALATLKDNGISGMSITTLGSLAYSDYQSPNYYSKGNLDVDVKNMLSKSGNKLNIMSSNANVYAAVYSKHIISTPSGDSNFNSLDVEVPFYRMVFKGLISMSSVAINTATNPRKEFLKAAETGCGLLYTVTNNFNADFRLGDSDLARSVYSDNKEDILSDYAEISKLLSKVSGAKITNHTLNFEEKSGVNKTDFENGVSVIVNYNKQPIETSFGKIEAESFIIQ